MTGDVSNKVVVGWVDEWMDGRMGGCLDVGLGSNYVVKKKIEKKKRETFFCTDGGIPLVRFSTLRCWQRLHIS